MNAGQVCTFVWKMSRKSTSLWLKCRAMYKPSAAKLNAELFNDEDVDCIIDCKVAERILVTSQQQPRISEETQLQRDYDNELF